MTPILPNSPAVSFTKSQTTPAIKKSVTEKVSPDLANQAILFGADGEVLNPEVRDNCKKILRSADCSPRTKEVMFETMWQQCDGDLAQTQQILAELETMTNEIVAEGGCLQLEDVNLRGGLLSMNCRGANLRGLTVIGHSISRCDMTDADMTGAKFSHCAFSYTKMIGAKCAGLVIENSSFVCTEVTDTNIVDPTLLKLRLGATDYRLWAYQADIAQTSIASDSDRYFLHGHMQKQVGPPALDPLACVIL